MREVTSEIPVVDIRMVTKRFSKSLDLTTKVIRWMGVKIPDETVHALDHVDLTINRGEVVGLVGESGCGKSTLGRIVAGLLKPSEGSIFYHGQDIGEFKKDSAKKNLIKIQLIFQDPFSSLNPRIRIGDILSEGPRVHKLIPNQEITGYTDALMRQCGLDPSDKRRYPHQFSGGQRQRIAIARALSVNPEFIVCDEVVSALDVSIQAQILNMFMKLREQYAFTSLFISHDLGVVEHVSDRVVIMYLGRILEEAPTEKLFDTPLHPYTKALLNEVPKIEKRRMDFKPIQGEIPSPIDPPSGCQFHPRCPDRKKKCESEKPLIREIETGHSVACHLF